MDIYSHILHILIKSANSNPTSIRFISQILQISQRAKQ